MRVTSDQIERARDVDLQLELQRRGIDHRGKWQFRRAGAGKEIVGPRPLSGGEDWFSAHCANRCFGAANAIPGAATSSHLSSGSTACHNQGFWR